MGTLHNGRCIIAELNGSLVLPVAARSKARVCGRSLAGKVDSNPAGGQRCLHDFSLCVVGYRSLRQAGHSSRGVPQNVVCHRGS